MVFHGSRLVSHGSRLVFHGARSFFMISGFLSWFQVGYHGFLWFQVGFSFFTSRTT